MNTTSKKQKCIFRRKREELKLSREKASQLIGAITPERLERIENGKFEPIPWEIVAMADAYNAPELRNYYCANKCEIGKKCRADVEIKEMPQIVLEILNSVNTLNEKKERLVQIVVDGVIDDEEIEDFVKIEEQLERISVAVESMNVWIEKMLKSGQIDSEKYKEMKKLKREQNNYH